MLEQLYRFRPATFFLPAFFFDAFAFVLPFFLDDEFRLLDLSDLAALFSFAVALRTDDFTLRFFGSALAICGALAPATPPATAPTAAPIGPSIEPAAAPAAAPPTIPTPDNDPESPVVAWSFSMRCVLLSAKSERKSLYIVACGACGINPRGDTGKLSPKFGHGDNSGQFVTLGQTPLEITIACFQGLRTIGPAR